MSRVISRSIISCLILLSVGTLLGRRLGRIRPVRLRDLVRLMLRGVRGILRMLIGKVSLISLLPFDSFFFCRLLLTLCVVLVNYVSVYQSTTPAAKANVHDFLAEPPVESALPLVQHQASAIHEVAHAAAGAVGQAPVEGVDPPRYDVAPGMVRQKIATETGSGNGTET